MATVPTPYDAVAGTKLSAAALDLGLKTPLDWLLSGYPRVHAYDTSGASMVNGVTTLVPFSSEVFDTDNMHDTATNSSRIVHTTAGLYDESWHITLGAVAYSQLDLMIRMNAAGAPAGGTFIRTQPFGGGPPHAYFQYLRFFAAGDYTEAFITQTSGANRLLSTAALGTRCMSRWVAVS